VAVSHFTHLLDPIMMSVLPVSSSMRRLGASCSLVALLAACSPHATPVSQVAIRINGDEVSVHQVELALQTRTAALPAEAASAATPSLLSSLVDQELAAQAARQRGRDRDPPVIHRLEAARRQVLAQAYQERVGARAAEPSSLDIDRYYDAHPELFAQRRLYQLQETTVRVKPTRFDELKLALEATPSLAGMQDRLYKQGLRTSARQLSVSAEDLPLNVVSRLAQLKDGESLVLPREGGARVLTRLAAQAAPLDPELARRLIAQFRVNERQRELGGASMMSLRDEAKVQYLGRYATLASGAAPAQPSDASAQGKPE
jgi:EpsD family peptidyl-prolyl cis-trans isomerase